MKRILPPPPSAPLSHSVRSLRPGDRLRTRYLNHGQGSAIISLDPPTPGAFPLLGSVLLSVWKLAFGTLLFCVAFVAGFAFLSPRHKSEGTRPLLAKAAAPVSPTYENDIAPLMAKYCLRCHAAD